MSERLILVARVAGAFGVRGELRITTFTEDPMALTTYRRLVREDGSPGLTLSGARPAKGGIVARAKEVADRDQAEAMRGLKLFISRADLPAPEEDEFYLADLIGLSVETPQGEPMGVVRSVQNFGAGDLVEIQPAAGAAWWLPFTRENVPEVNLATGKVVAIRPTEIEAPSEGEA
jgi:16S rRNA processing protein RimM